MLSNELCSPEHNPGNIGAKHSHNGNTVDINSDGYGSLSCRVSITGLSSFEGYGYYDGVAFLTLLDPNGNYMYATFDGWTLTVYDSSWSLLPSGTSFYGFG